MVVTGAVELNSVFDSSNFETKSAFTIVHNPRWQSGLASSLQSGIDFARNLGAQAVVIGLADQPAVLATAWLSVAASSAPLAVATYNGVRGNPVRLHAELWQLLPQTGDDGARLIFKSHRDLIEEIPCSGSAQDVDTLADLASVQKMFGDKNA